MFIGVIVLIVLMALCAVLGGIYSYIYYTRINPGRSRKVAYGGGMKTGADGSLPGSGGDDYGGGGGAGTHLFLFRKPAN
jgi:hypothetical protein